MVYAAFAICCENRCSCRICLSTKKETEQPVLLVHELDIEFKLEDLVVLVQYCIVSYRW